ncbi:MAG: hypothetical protein D3922_00130 [Candidatus Electrothrix sp. AR1]|nr:hypothetical protein [Candidatus Electrothrix sp. AR1]
MFYQIKITNDQKGIDKQKIGVKLNVPPTDIPFSAQVKANDKSDIVEIILDYNSDKEKKKSKTENGVTVVWGVESGRVYKIEVKDFSNLLSGNVKQTISLIGKTEKKKSRRFRNNLKLGAGVVQQSLDRTLVALHA